ncbi:MAG: M13 family metallopeptidase [bacterium]
MHSRHTTNAANAALAIAVSLGALSPRLAAAQQKGGAFEAVLAPLKVIDVAYVNRSANACTDFNAFANGAWLARDTIPAAYSSSGVARDMGDRNELVVRAVLDDAMKRAPTLPASSTEHKLGVFYGTCMDSAAAEKAGAAPLKPLLARIDQARTRAAVLSEIAELHRMGGDVAFGFGPGADLHDAAHYTTFFSQGGLGLPDRDYYTNAGAEADSTRRMYVDHIARLFVLSGRSAAIARADARKIMALETELAKASLTQVEQREPANLDHPMAMRELTALTPNVDWAAYMQAAGVTVPVSNVIVQEPAFFKRLNALVAETPLDVWRAYLTYHAFEQASPWLSAPYVKENFAFTSKFSGAKALLPRWKRCLRKTDGTIGEALGEAYVARTFSPEAKARAKAVIDDIRASFAERVKRLDWMSDTTKARAIEKLTLMHEKVGYPDQWRNYEQLVVANGPFVLNVANANAFEWNRTINRPGSAVDSTEWGMTVPTVNAYYDGQKNEMVFPAGALAPQTFDAKADDAANYGSLGASWAGHELTHGFDDQGRHFDAKGNLRDWWALADSVHFSQQATLVADQYSGYVQVDTLHVNGRLTLGENIADYGGVLTGFDALQHALARNGRPGLIDGFTPEQRFFIAYAQSFRTHTRSESLRSRQMTDPHSPDTWRVNGPLANIPAFASAFGCKPGDPMVRNNSAVGKIW